MWLIREPSLQDRSTTCLLSASTRNFRSSSCLLLVRDPVRTPSSGALSKHEGRRCEEAKLLLEEVLDLLLDDWVGIFHL